ncbi:hypothetical protein OLK93_004866 [Escherichia coli]|nr:hypothetical protein [Escherichia coli]
MSSDLQTNIESLINRSTNYRRFFHLAYTHVVRDKDTSQLPRYAMTRHADFVRLVVGYRTLLENISWQLSDPEIHDPDFTLLVGGACSCMSEQREFDASIDDLYGELKSLLRTAYQLSPSQQVAQLAIDSRPDFVRWTLRYIWDVACDTQFTNIRECDNLFLRGESVRDVERNFPGFVNVLTSNIEFFEPVLSSLPKACNSWITLLEHALKWEGKRDVNNQFWQEWNALQSLLCDLID